MLDPKLLEKLSPDELAELNKMLGEYEVAKTREAAKEGFLPFVKYMWPKFIEGEQHRIMGQAFERIARGEKRFLIINMPPRHGKSELASKYFPAWFMGKFPDKKIIMSSHTASLAVDFGRAVKNIVALPHYREIFAGVNLKADSKAAGRWGTSDGGEYYAIGTGGAIAGRGADLYVIDDPHSEQDAINALHNPDVWSKVWDWYTGGPVQRLQPGGSICLVMCVAGKEKVLLSDGSWVAMENLNEGDGVVTYKNGNAHIGTVKKHTSCGMDQIIKVTSTSCSVRVNARHPFLVIRKTASVRSAWEVEWVKAGDLVEGDRVFTIKDISDVHDNKGLVPIPKNPNGKVIKGTDMWLLGYLWGDGWIDSKNSIPYRVCVAGSDKPDLDEIVRSGLAVWADFEVDNIKDTNGTLRLNSRKVGEWLVDVVGFKGSAHTKRVPDWIFSLHPKLKREFIHGYLAADGWLRPSKKVETWTATSVNNLMLEDFRLLSRTCGVRCSNIYRYDGKGKPPGSKQEIDFTQYSCRFSFKHKVIENKTIFSQLGKTGKDFRIETIKSLEPDGQDEVFDIEVEGSGNFIAEGFVVHNTRWSKLDLTGMILEDAKKKGRIDEWEVIELPAELPSGNFLWEDFWSVEDYKRIKDSIPKSKWLAQYQQNPTSEEGAIIKRESWRRWERATPPDCKFVIISWDTAFDKTARSDYSACTVWGIFYPDEDEEGVPHVMLLDAYKEKLEFPELKKKAYTHYREVMPDTIIIEKKAAGAPLIYELRAMGIPVSEYTPSRGNDKIVRANAVSDLFQSGVVWAPNTAWADDVIEECAEFPNGAHDDYVDSTTQALIRLRHGGLVTIESDDADRSNYEPYKAPYYRVGNK